MRPNSPAASCRSSRAPSRGSATRLRPVRAGAKGLALVEMLIALAVGVFLLGGIIQMLVSSKASYRLSEAQSRIQENGRYAAYTLARELRGSRSAGCRSALMEAHFQSLNVLACDLLDTDGQTGCTGRSAIGPAVPLGYDASQRGTGNWLAQLPGNTSTGGQAAVAAAWLRGDVLVSWGTAGSGALVSASGSVLADRTGPLDLVSSDSDSSFRLGDLALVTDCVGSDIFEVADGAGGDPDGPLDSLPHARNDAQGGQANREPSALSRAYGLNPTNTGTGLVEARATDYRPRVFPFAYQVFFICCVDTRDGERETGAAVQNCTTNPERYRPALCRWSAGESVQALIQDVADMRVTYDGTIDASAERAEDAGLDSSVNSRFEDLDAVTDAAWVSSRGYWERVDSARIRLLVTAGESVRTESAAPNPDAVDPNDPGYGLPADRRLYDLYEVTVSNRAGSPWFVGR